MPNRLDDHREREQHPQDREDHPRSRPSGRSMKPSLASASRSGRGAARRRSAEGGRWRRWSTSVSPVALLLERAGRTSACGIVIGPRPSTLDQGVPLDRGSSGSSRSCPRGRQCGRRETFRPCSSAEPSSTIAAVAGVAKSSRSRSVERPIVAGSIAVDAFLGAEHEAAVLADAARRRRRSPARSSGRSATSRRRP